MSTRGQSPVRPWLRTPNNRTLRAEIDLANVDGRLRPGQFGRVTITLLDLHNILTIPSSGLIDQTGGGEAVCYRIIDGRAKRTRIKVGVGNGDHVEVREGLKEGDSVIVDPSQGLTDGQPISINHSGSGK